MIQICKPPLYLPFSSLSIPWSPASLEKGDAKNPCLRISDSLCSPHTYIHRGHCIRIIIENISAASE